MTSHEKTTGPTQDTPHSVTEYESDGSQSGVGKKSLGHYLRQEVRASMFTELQLVILTFCTGIQDATTFPDYHCFASNQTGNTVFLCLALILPELNGEMFFTANIGMALGLFLGAGWLTGQLSHIIGSRKRWWLILCNLVQSSCVLGAAAIQYRHGIKSQGSEALAVVGLLAFAAGSQVVQSRSLSMTEISTAMATAAWVDLMIDQNLFVLKNRPRTRRVAFLLALVVGSLVGAAIYREVGSATAIAVSGGGKLIVTLLYLFSPAQKAKKEQSPA
ncbi:hypothetical protein VFPPC_15142 [Pochonia chlamydosporia 170]|uniref:DUF1275 domain-containing protein n=1 Tax=Pochonia chlamydosporia 170 TaxID=1380566 RepID=A0A179G3M9_METCM|nr:hypothetical protein VFPPC_15142 [Pochonia chlamydosporia 170]OAQ72476.1 hypothetical protein VFPPC_15142 [Pochonia chlamydosporia 170]